MSIKSISISEEIKGVRAKPSHFVLLGAGASRAAFPSGEGSGKKLPLMDDFVEIVPVKPLLDRCKIEWKDRNIEEIYSYLTTDPLMSDILKKLESLIYDYFSSMSLPTTPTLYDHLILSLRKKDFIATFNWDPFLIQAYKRNEGKVESLPTLLFLHGNVETAFCFTDNIHGTKGGLCKKCDNPYKPTKLLYPIKNKDYTSNPEIAEQWDCFSKGLKDTLFFTIFGYSAPASDIEAIKYMQLAWGKTKERDKERIEIIDIKDHKTLEKNWEEFRFSHHFETNSDFYDSWIANHPRRTIEAYIDQFFANKCHEKNPLPSASRHLNL